jgi:hypothetical protein
MLTKTKLYIIYGILGAILVGVLSYNLGYESKHTPKYLSIDNHKATKAMQNAGITEQQIDKVYDQLKNKR